MVSLKRKSTETSSSENPLPHQNELHETEENNTTTTTTSSSPSHLILNETPITCLHVVSYPENYNPNHTQNSNSFSNKPPTKEFPFELDPFQSEAIKCLNNGESVMVTITEIWRSMQYKGSEILREVAWVIFDEVHYMHDRERGVVWEESIVMAAKNSNFVILSATVLNAKEFADHDEEDIYINKSMCL
ncbi:Atp-dependent rna helicase dob1 [Thalictrum thalictroides]|uniref:Atp-dependent rna helicase dob1 n=1 Tax=Thalictrum thalictroides TaxID=46969 RepID=A0A7J6X4C6_THATH|nr:Atp-dependent rna helicase dob1 [Thalictrum thalictroides]